jgi:uncharacterized protein (DUF2384 family)
MIDIPGHGAGGRSRRARDRPQRQAALALTRLRRSRRLSADSTNAASADFQGANTGAWTERPQPRSVRRPSDLLDTATGADIVVRLLGSMASGAT